MKTCKKCLKDNVREQNGIAVSKWCVPCRKEKELIKKEKHKLTKTYQKSRLKILHSKAWKLFSEYIRRKNANEWGRVKCYTCPTELPWQQMQAGHFLHGKLDFDERNIHPQCAQCNLYKSGNLAIYAVGLAKELGVEGMERLLLDSNITKYSCEDIENIINITNQKLKYDIP